VWGVLTMSMQSTGLSHHETPRMQRRTYTIEEVAAQLGLARNSAYVAARANELPVPTIRIGRRMFVSKVALDRFLEGEAA
jgi:excisionase family DNA binding protein